MAPEKRFLVIAADGRATTASRGTEPDEETLDTAAEGLDAVGLGGWLVVVEPTDDGRGSTVLRPVRRVTATAAEWPEIEAAYRARLAARGASASRPDRAGGTSI